MVFYVIIRGPLGSGKSTIAERIAKELKAEHILIDKILDEHKLTEEREAGYISQKSFCKANEIIMPKAKKSLKNGIPVIFDGNFYWKSQIDDLIRKLDFPHYVFTLRAPLKVCIERDHQRRKTHGEAAVQAVYKKSIGFGYGRAINVNMPLDDCIKNILSYLPNP
ncbi:ATP-binding protein [Candidatus Woesearchaeota archaeon]|nr:ATP-binding protein [Candidatus Woesearchaeota archaeon]